MRTQPPGGPISKMTAEDLEQKMGLELPNKSPYESTSSSAVDHPQPTPENNDEGVSAVHNSESQTSTENIIQEISAIHDSKCRLVERHVIGDFCKECRTVLMTWFDKLPQPVDENGEFYSRAPQGSIVRDVLLQDPESVAVIILVANADIINEAFDEVDGLPYIMEHYPKAVSAGLLIAEVYRVIARVSTPEHDIPTIADIVEAALQNPALTADEYVENTKAGLEKHHPLRSDFGRAVFSIYDEYIPDGSSDTFPRVDISKGPNVQGSYTNPHPKGKGPWEFVPGSDTSRAQLDVPEPHKFFMIRQTVGNPDKKDIRLYPSWETMNWSNQLDINRLNRWQRTSRRSMPNGLEMLRPQWSQAEKDFLKMSIEAALSGGQDRDSIDWNDIANSMFVHFKDKTEKAGQPLAQYTELFPDNTIGAPQGKLRRLTNGRVGAVKRTGTALSIQANKYGDIALLLRLSMPPYKASGPRDDDHAVEDMTGIRNEKNQGKVAKPKGGRGRPKKRPRAESPDARSKSPAKNPPTSAEQFKAQVHRNLNPWYKSKIKSNTPAPLPNSFDDEEMALEGTTMGTTTTPASFLPGNFQFDEDVNLWYKIKIKNETPAHFPGGVVGDAMSLESTSMDMTIIPASLPPGNAQVDDNVNPWYKSEIKSETPAHLQDGVDDEVMSVESKSMGTTMIPASVHPKIQIDENVNPWF